MTKMTVRVLSQKKTKNGITEFTKQRTIQGNVFIYDEDCFWFDYKGERFAFSIPEIIKLRKNTIKEIQKAINEDKK